MAISKKRAEQDGMNGGGCPELKNKEKLDWDDIEGEDITISQVVKTTNADGEPLIAVICEEHADFFMWAGAAITKWVDYYGDEFLGTVIHVGPIGKTKAGRKCRKFDIV